MSLSTKKPLLAVIGRSNTGKSSLCRLLAPRSAARLIKVGKKPGVTRGPREIDNGDYTIVDLPGFGYMAHASKKFQGDVQDRIIGFIEERHREVFLAIEVLNIEAFRTAFDKHKDASIPFDKELFDFLQEFEIPTVVLANKADKLRENAVDAEMAYVTEALGLRGLPSFPPGNLLPFSAKEGAGVAVLKEKIRTYLEAFTRD
ncbi:MAG: 50S ribosome-binding GTPase [Candidatus Lokiarchaeota archaeon]|nr:50S ribosome-binding GTPase [Candidatus Lokiarchaeota archaeon]